MTGVSPRCGGRVGVGQKRAYPFLLAVSFVLGVLSHIVWDLFTHEGRWGVQAIPGLEEMWGPLPGFKWLQHGSSLIGLAIIAIWALLSASLTGPATDRRAALR